MTERHDDPALMTGSHALDALSDDERAPRGRPPDVPRAAGRERLAARDRAAARLRRRTDRGPPRR
ncbi:hypothetical protein Q9Q99_10690 [Curtobacterium flaccumfaciens]|nr:hypothetical protein Q9Q99_10690 [Curtobacterium flaccumfaciens]